MKLGLLLCLYVLASAVSLSQVSTAAIINTSNNFNVTAECYMLLN